MNCTVQAKYKITNLCKIWKDKPDYGTIFRPPITVNTSNYSCVQTQIYLSMYKQRGTDPTIYQRAILCLTLTCNLCNALFDSKEQFGRNERHCKWCGRGVCTTCEPYPISDDVDVNHLTIADICAYECRVCTFHHQAAEAKKEVKYIYISLCYSVFLQTTVINTKAIMDIWNSSIDRWISRKKSHGNRTVLSVSEHH